VAVQGAPGNFDICHRSALGADQRAGNLRLHFGQNHGQPHQAQARGRSSALVQPCHEPGRICGEHFDRRGKALKAHAKQGKQFGVSPGPERFRHGSDSFRIDCLHIDISLLHGK